MVRSLASCVVHQLVERTQQERQRYQQQVQAVHVLVQVAQSVVLVQTELLQESVLLVADHQVQAVHH